MTRCPECGEAFEAGTFDVGIRRTMESWYPPHIVWPVAIIAATFCIFFRMLWWWAAIVMLVVLVEIPIQMRRRHFRQLGLRQPRLVCTPTHLRVMKGSRDVGHWRWALFTRIDRNNARRSTVRVKLFDRLGESFSTRLVCSEELAERIVQEINRRIQQAQREPSA